MFVFAGFFALLQAAWAPQFARAQTTRPDIATVEARAHDLGPKWERIKEGQLSALAYVLEVYDGPIYFLARDMEPLYDLALAILPKAEHARLHLLNVSRNSKNSKHLREYVRQEGITEESIKSEQIVLFESGVKGTIPQAIRALFPDAIRNKLLGHYLLIGAEEPSSWSFVEKLVPGALVERERIADRNHLVDQVEALFKTYEAIPKFVGRSNDYQYDEVQKRWEPVASEFDVEEAKVLPDVALQYMQDTKAYAQTNSVKQSLRHQRATWRYLRGLTKNQNKSYLLAALKKLIQNGRLSKEVLAEYLEYLELRKPVPFRIGKLELGADTLLIAKYQGWEAVLRDPHFQLKRMAEENFDLFLKFMNEVTEERVRESIYELLPELRPETVQKVILSQATDVFKTRQMFQYYFSKEHSLPNFDLLPQILSGSGFNEILFSSLCNSVMSQSFAHKRIDILLEIFSGSSRPQGDIAALVHRVLVNISNDADFLKLLDVVLLDLEKRPSNQLFNSIIVALLERDSARGGFGSYIDRVFNLLFQTPTYPSSLRLELETFARFPAHPVVGRNAARLSRRLSRLGAYEGSHLLQSFASRIIQAHQSGVQIDQRLIDAIFNAGIKLDEPHAPAALMKAGFGPSAAPSCRTLFLL